MQTPPKPQEVTYAEWSLWAWATWACLWGLYQAMHDLPGQVRQINDSAGGMISLSPQSFLKWLVLYYLSQAAATVWFILKIGQGKHWARSSFMWCFVLEILWMGATSFISFDLSWSDIPDIALQFIALYYLYTQPGAGWFPLESKQGIA